MCGDRKPPCGLRIVPGSPRWDRGAARPDHSAARPPRAAALLPDAVRRTPPACRRRSIRTQAANSPYGLGRKHRSRRGVWLDGQPAGRQGRILRSRRFGIAFSTDSCFPPGSRQRVTYSGCHSDFLIGLDAGGSPAPEQRFNRGETQQTAGTDGPPGTRRRPDVACRASTGHPASAVGAIYGRHPAGDRRFRASWYVADHILARRPGGDG
jgi:hypothetical protein